jgi:hypothetical protein
VFVEDAVAVEPTAGARDVEYRRKVRVLMRGLRCAVSVPGLFDPRRHGFYALQLASHKVLMRVMAVPLIALAVSAPALWRRGPVYRIATLGQAVSYALAAVGTFADRHRLARSRAFALPAYFCLVQAASLEATIRVLRGARVDRWTPERGAEAPDAAAGAEQVPGPNTSGGPRATTAAGAGRPSVAARP